MVGRMTLQLKCAMQPSMQHTIMNYITLFIIMDLIFWKYVKTKTIIFILSQNF